MNVYIVAYKWFEDHKGSTNISVVHAESEKDAAYKLIFALFRVDYASEDEWIEEIISPLQDDYLGDAEEMLQERFRIAADFHILEDMEIIK